MNTGVTCSAQWLAQPLEWTAACCWLHGECVRQDLDPLVPHDQAILCNGTDILCWVWAVEWNESKKLLLFSIQLTTTLCTKDIPKFSFPLAAAHGVPGRCVRKTDSDESSYKMGGGRGGDQRYWSLLKPLIWYKILQNFIATEILRSFS